MSFYLYLPKTIFGVWKDIKLDYYTCPDHDFGNLQWFVLSTLFGWKSDIRKFQEYSDERKAEICDSHR